MTFGWESRAHAITWLRPFGLCEVALSYWREHTSELIMHPNNIPTHSMQHGCYYFYFVLKTPNRFCPSYLRQIAHKLIVWSVFLTLNGWKVCLYAIILSLHNVPTRSKIKYTPKPSNQIGRKQKVGPKEFTLGFESMVWKNGVALLWQHSSNLDNTQSRKHSS